MFELSSLKPNAVDSYAKILSVFVRDDKPKTWNEIYKRTKLSKGCFSQRFRELVESGNIEGKIVVNNGKLIPIYTWTKKPPVFCLGETGEVLRVYFDKKGKGIIRAEERVKRRRMRSGKRDRRKRNIVGKKTEYTRRIPYQ